METKALKRAFGRRLRFLRGVRAMTQADLAEAADVSIEHLSNIERGKSAPSFGLLTLLADIFNVEPATFFLFSVQDMDGGPDAEDMPQEAPWPGLGVHMGICETNADTGECRWSDTLYDLLGVRPGAVRPSCEAFLEFVHPDDRHLLVQNQEDLLADRRVGAVHYRFHRRDGSLRYALGHSHKVHESDGGTRTVCLLLDVTESRHLDYSLRRNQDQLEEVVQERTRDLLESVDRLKREVAERKAAQQRLRASQERLTQAQAMARLGSWEHDAVTGEMTWSDEVFRVMGYEPGTAEPSFDLAIAHVDEAGQERIRAIYEEGGEDAFEFESAVHGEDGLLRYVHAAGRARRDKAGRILGTMGTAQDVTDRVLQQNALRETEAMLEGILAATTDLIIMYDRDLRVVWANPSGLEALGPGAVGRICHRSFHGSREPCEGCNVLRTFADGQPHEHEAVYHIGGVTTTYWCVSGVAARDDAGRPRLVVEIARDVTRRLQSEQESVRARRLFEEALENSQGALYRVDLDADRFDYLSPAFERITGHDAEQWSGRTRAEAEALIHPEDAERLTTARHAALEVHDASSPLHMQNEYRLRCADGSWRWLLDRCTLLFEDGEPRWAVGSIADMDAARRSELALKRSQTLFRQALRSSQQVLYRRDHSRDRFEYLSPALERLTGHRLAETAPHGSARLWELVHPEDKPGVEAAISAAIAGAGDGEARGEAVYRIRCADDEYRWFRNAFTILLGDDGEPETTIGSLSAMDEASEALAALERNDVLFREALEHAHGCLYRLNLETGTYDYLSQALAQILGCDPDGFAREGFAFSASLLHPDDREILERLAGEMLAVSDGPRRMCLEYRLRTKDGDYRWFRDTCTVRPADEFGPTRAVGATQDAHEIKTLLERLDQVRRRHHELMATAQDFHYRIDLVRGCYETLSPAYEAITGLSPEEWEGRPLTDSYEYIHPDDLARVLRERETLVAKAQGRNHSGRQIYRLRCADDSWRWMQDSFSVIFSPGGEPEAVVGCVRDVHEARTIRRELVKSRQYFAETLADSRDFLYRMDLKTKRYDYISPGLARMWDVDPRDLEREGLKVTHECFHPDDRKNGFTRLRRMLRPGKGPRKEEWEVRMRGKDGEYRLMRDSLTVYFDREGKPDHVVGSVRDVTDQRAAEARLAASEERYRQLFDLGSDALFLIDVDAMRILDANTRAQEMYGYTREEFQGMEATRIAASSHRGIMERNVRGAVPTATERTHVHRDGREFPVEITANFFQLDGRRVVLSSVRDVSQRRRRERDLSLYRKALEGSTEAVIIRRADMGLVFANDAAVELLGPRPDVLDDAALDAVFAPESAEVFRNEILPRMRRRESWTGELLLRGAGGEQRSVLCGFSVQLDSADDPELCIAILRDTTPHRRLQRLREDAEQLMRHDLKGPISATIALPRALLHDDNLTASQRRLLGMLENAGEQMLEMIDLYLALPRMESGDYELKAEPVELRYVLAESKRTTRELFESMRAQLRLDLPGGGDVLVSGERLLLSAMVGNLVQNAAEAAQPGETVHLGLGVRDGAAEITVRNRAVVPEALRATFFDKYATFGKDRGTGLGTYSARLIAEAHGGEVDMRSSAAEGTEVTVLLPLTGAD